MNYYGSICLSDIPKEVIKEGKNGKKYLNITVWERKLASEWGHTHTISCAPQAGRTERRYELSYRRFKTYQAKTAGRQFPESGSR